jgi:predicted regulator of Ras-like GTPase activity (Roadblock/LC7/MglB family)
MFIILLHGYDFVLSSPGLIMTERLISHFEIRTLARIFSLFYAKVEKVASSLSGMLKETQVHVAQSKCSFYYHSARFGSEMTYQKSCITVQR